MTADMPLPPLRKDLEIIPTLYGRERAFVIRDFLGLIRKPIVLQGDALSVVGLLDGARSLRDIQVAMVRMKKGMLVSLESVEAIIRSIDSAMLLESERYFKAREKLLAEYERLETRQASHAGQSYPANPRDLRLYLDTILAIEGGKPSDLEDKMIRGLIAPHIDFEVGKRVYAKAFGAVRKMKPATIILLGTGHNLQDGFFSVTAKDFETPLGPARTDKGIVSRLKKAGGEAVSPTDLAHRREHSLEFSLVFLQHLFGIDFLVVPVLCGSFAQEFGRASRPADIRDVGEVLTVLRGYLAEFGSEALVVAGVDFSHIGIKFGHSRAAASLMLEARQHDQALIEALKSGDVEAFWAESRRVKDMYNVCGFSAMAVLLEILSPVEGRFLDYDFWREDPTQSAVSFAALALTS